MTKVCFCNLAKGALDYLVYMAHVLVKILPISNYLCCWGKNMNFVNFDNPGLLKYWSNCIDVRLLKNTLSILNKTICVRGSISALDADKQSTGPNYSFSSFLFPHIIS